MGKLVYTINDRGYIAIIEKASYSTQIGIVNPANPLVLCMRDDLLRYHPSLSTEDAPIIDVRVSMQVHIDANLMSSDALNLLPA
jgi:hypothetical protein